MNDLFNEIFSSNPKLTTSISFIIGLLLISDLNAAQQHMLGNFIFLIGQTISTNASAQNLIEARIFGEKTNINSKKVKSIYNPAFYDINKLKEIINQFYPNNTKDLELISKALKDLEKKVNELKKD